MGRNLEGLFLYCLFVMYAGCDSNRILMYGCTRAGRDDVTNGIRIFVPILVASSCWHYDSVPFK